MTFASYVADGTSSFDVVAGDGVIDVRPVTVMVEPGRQSGTMALENRK
jgi:hypothetical protein